MLFENGTAATVALGLKLLQQHLAVEDPLVHPLPKIIRKRFGPRSPFEPRFWLGKLTEFDVLSNGVPGMAGKSCNLVDALALRS